jgi:cytochrome c oxidase cbb3-type subunit 2
LYVQLGFVDRLQQLALGPAQTRYVLAAMGLAGFTTSLAAPLLLRTKHPVWALRLGFLLSFLAIALSMVSGAFPLLLLAAAGMSLGLSLGYVSLIATARPSFRARRIGVKVGLGTGLAYAICSVPWLFLASPEAKGLFSLVACAAGGVMTFAMHDAAPLENLATARTGEEPKAEPAGFISILMIFFALVWLDSGAFAVILDNPKLKQAFWGTDALQWRNSALHFASALLGGWLIDRGRLRSTLTLSYLVIVLAIHLLQQPMPMAMLASAGYVCAASLYTVALFAYAPACLGHDGGPRLHGRWVLFALAAWVGSTLGIGMMQDLQAVPTWVMAIAGCVIGVALLVRMEPYSARHLDAI